VKVAPAKGWPDGVTPKAAQGTRVAAFATGLQHPRWVYVLPNGDVLVAETAAPQRPDEGKGLKGRAMTYFMKKAGSAAPSAIASRCCAMRMATAFPSCGACSWKTSIRRSAWCWSE
jgi:glucose/arabinose dehydrogenase